MTPTLAKALGCTVALLAAAPDSAAAADATVFRDVAVFDGQKRLAPTTVVVRDGVIDAIGPDAKAPDGAEIVDGKGKTLLPGLIDCHTHTYQPVFLEQALVFGVTTTLDMFTAPPFAERMRRRQSEPGKDLNRADLFSAGTLVTAPGGHGTQYGMAIPTITSPDEAQEFVDARIAEGSDYIKIVYDDFTELGREIPTISRETLAAVIRAAHARKKLAVVHVLALDKARDALASGANGLVHIFVDAPADDEVIRLAREAKAFVVPTLTVQESMGGRKERAALGEDADLGPHVGPADVQQLKQGFPKGPNSKASYDAGRESVRRFHKAGVPILAGTDAPNPGTLHGASMHRELELLVEASLTPAEALAAATSLPAEKFALADRGRIAPRLRADLVLVEGDPTQDIKATRKIVGVWKRGQRLDREEHRKAIQAQQQEASAAASAPAAAASETGRVSDFEGKTLKTAFGAGWAESTDAMMGGQSTTTFKWAPDGARGSGGCMRIAGNIEDRPQPRWAGAMFFPGSAPMAPADLSQRKELSFWARGDGKTYTVMLFFKDRGRNPSMRSFVAGEAWKAQRFKLADFDGCDGRAVMGLFLGGGEDAGAFEFFVDDVQFE